MHSDNYPSYPCVVFVTFMHKFQKLHLLPPVTCMRVTAKGCLNLVNENFGVTPIHKILISRPFTLGPELGCACLRYSQCIKHGLKLQCLSSPLPLDYEAARLTTASNRSCEASKYQNIELIHCVSKLRSLMTTSEHVRRLQTSFAQE